MRLFKLIILLFILLLFIGTTSALKIIYDCEDIEKSGEYKLNQNISNYYGTCIEIFSNDVIVDGAGYTIDVDPNYPYVTYGVKVDGHSNVTVKNLKLTDLDYGIHYYDVSNGFIFNNDVSYINNDVYINARGISIISSDNITISENTASNNEYGINIEFFRLYHLNK